MIPVVLTVGVVNVVLGFALALYLERLLAPVEGAALPVYPTGDDSKVSNVSNPQTTARPDEDPVKPANECSPLIPTEWLDEKTVEDTPAAAFLSASADVLRLDVNRYLECLLTLEDRLRDAKQTPDHDDLETCLRQAKQLNRNWLREQTDALEHLEGNKEELGDFVDSADRLINVLLDQAAQIESTLSNLDHFDTTAAVDEFRDKLLRETLRLVGLAHTLGERMQEAMVAIVVGQNQLEAFGDDRLKDRATGLFNRVGFEKVIIDWFVEDPTRQRQVSLLLLDVDRVTKMNLTHGTRSVDLLLGHLAEKVATLVRADRDYDVVIRFGGQSLACFLGDTGPHEAVNAAERIRQSVERTEFRLGSTAVKLTLTAASTEIEQDEAPDVALGRLSKTLRAAKRMGRNCTCVDDGDGPEPVDAPELTIEPDVIDIQTHADAAC